MGGDLVASAQLLAANQNTFFGLWAWYKISASWSAICATSGIGAEWLRGSPEEAWRRGRGRERTMKMASVWREM